MSPYLKNWKTTSAGIVAIITAIGIYVNEPSKYIESVTLLLAGIGMILSADADQDTEQKTNSVDEKDI